MASSAASICFAFNDHLPTEFECVQNILMHSPGGRPEEEHESKLRKRVVERYISDVRQVWEVAFPGRVVGYDQVKQSIHRLLEDHYGKVFRAPVNNKLSNTAKLNVSRKNRLNWKKEHSVLFDLLACDPAELEERDHSFYLDQKIAREMFISKHVKAGKRKSKGSKTDQAAKSDCEGVEATEVDEKVEQQVPLHEENFLPLEALKMPSPESEVDEPAEMAAALIKQIEENMNEDEEDSELEDLIEQAKTKFGIERQQSNEKGNVSDCGESVIEVKKTQTAEPASSQPKSKGKKSRHKKVVKEEENSQTVEAEQIAAPESDALPTSSSDQQYEDDAVKEDNAIPKKTSVALRPEIVIGITLTAVLAITRAKQLKYF